MKKVLNSPAGVATMLALLMVSPLLIGYAVYGKTKNGHIVLRYPTSTQIISTSTEAPHQTTLVGSDDCSPEYKLVTVSNGRFSGAQRARLSQKDIEEWHKVMAKN